jgi:ribosome maturation factor RimP
MEVLDQISALARRVAETHGLDVVDTELFRAGRRRVVRVYIAKAAGVSIDDCAKVSREMSAVLDAENWLGDLSYVIEVSSPGLDRPFKTLADWTRNVDREVRVTCREKFEGKTLYSGKLLEATADAVKLEVPAKGKAPAQTVEIPMAQIALAKLEVKLS